MSLHHKVILTDSNAQQFAKVAIMTVFVHAINDSDARTQRSDISEGLRMATIRGIDGLDILRQALNEKYEATKANVTAPLKVVATDGFQCPKCNKPFKSANALNAHRPTKCNG